MCLFLLKGFGIQWLMVMFLSLEELTQTHTHYHSHTHVPNQLSYSWGQLSISLLVQMEMSFFRITAYRVFYWLCFLNCKDRTIYNMCTQKPPHDYSQQLYDKYRESFVEYINSTVRVIYSYLFSFYILLVFGSLSILTCH